MSDRSKCWLGVGSQSQASRNHVQHAQTLEQTHTHKPSNTTHLGSSEQRRSHLSLVERSVSFAFIFLCRTKSLFGLSLSSLSPSTVTTTPSIAMDDLLDLAWQPSQGGAQSKPPASSSSLSSSAFNGTNSNTAFSSSASRPNYYGSSSLASQSPSKPSTGPASSQRTAEPDAFSSLFSLSSSAKQEANLSLAERQKLVREQALKKSEDDKRRNDALWSGISSSSFGATANGASSLSAPSRQSPAPTAHQRLNSPAPIASVTSIAANPAPANSSATQAADPWDFDALSSGLPSASKPSASSMPPPKAQSRNDPFDFDSFDQPFTTPKVAVHADEEDPADDILGALAMPVSEPPKQSLSALDPRVAALSSSASISSAGSSRVPSPASGSRPVGGRSTPARSTSPPPHVIGQIVDMREHDGVEQFLLRSVIMIEERFRHLAGGCQFGHRRAVEPDPGEQGRRLIEDRLPPLLVIGCLRPRHSPPPSPARAR